MRELRRLRTLYPKLDMQERVIDEIEDPPASPEECIFARTTQTISADLKTAITPCQFGGDPDCSQCGCNRVDGAGGGWALPRGGAG